MWLLPISILVVTTLLAIPLSKYFSWIMDGKYRPWGPFRWIENNLNSGPQNWKQYTGALLLFNTVLFVFGFTLTFHKITPGEGAGARFEQLDLHSGSMLTCPVDVSGARPGQLWCDATYRVPRRAI